MSHRRDRGRKIAEIGYKTRILRYPASHCTSTAQYRYQSYWCHYAVALTISVNTTYAAVSPPEKPAISCKRQVVDGISLPRR